MAGFVRPRLAPVPLSTLIDGAPRVAIRGLTSHSADVREGDLFAALPGVHVHGATFAADAVRRGAAAILTDAAGAEVAGEAGVPVVVLENPAEHLGPIAAALYGNPGERLTSFAVTGTNGKTTVAFMVEELLRLLGHRPGLIGTIAVRVGATQIPAEMTTPVPADLQALLATFAGAGADSLTMEVSSHALAQGRTDPLCFDVAGFTNLTQDHLDFHKTMERYYEAKRSLFTPVRSRRAVITVDDAWGRRLLTEALVPAVALSASGIIAPESAGEGAPDAAASAANAAPDAPVQPAPAPTAGWIVRDVSAAPDRSDFALVWTGADPDGWRAGVRVPVSLRLPGSFNVANAALAIAMVLESRIATPEAVAAALRGGFAPSVPGRMEQIAAAPRVIVDFAHNEAALTNAVEALLPTTRGRLIVLTGSAGERDHDKRPAMARAVAERADLLYITDDDPHGEDPAQIRADLLSGTHGGKAEVIEIADRTEAIRAAIAGAADSDTVLLAGRGHETLQPVGERMIPLDDRVVARQALAERGKEAR